MATSWLTGVLLGTKKKERRGVRSRYADQMCEHGCIRNQALLEEGRAFSQNSMVKFLEGSVGSGCVAGGYGRH